MYYTWVSIHIHISFLCQLGGPRSNNNPVAMSTPSTQILVSWCPFSNKRNQGSLKKWLILGLGQEMYKMRLEHLGITDIQEVPPKQKKPKLHNDEGILEGHQEPTKRTTQGQNWKNLSNKIQCWIIIQNLKEVSVSPC